MVRQIHCPVRMPTGVAIAEQRLDSFMAKQNAVGMRKAKSVSDGNNLTANYERLASIS
jgi:hypothetical protein